MSGEIVTIFDELKQYIREALWGMPGVSTDANGYFYSEGYKDYDDELADAQISDILDGIYRYTDIDGKERIEIMKPKAVLERMVENAYMESYFACRRDIIDELMENPDISRIAGTLSAAEFDLEEYLEEIWDYRYPYDDFLEQDVCVDIMLDTGDRNYEFTCNNLASTNIENVEEFDDDSSLLWLCEQQGVTREELLTAFDKGTAHSDEVERLRWRGKLLTSELQAFGFVLPRFAESVIHTGAYREYTKLQEGLVARQGDIKRLQTKYAENNISYADYLKKHFDMYQRLDPMTEEQFSAKKAEVLAQFDARIKEAEEALADIQAKLAESPDYAKVARLQGEYRDVKRQLAELAKTDEYKKAEFINSVHNECLNTYGSSVVTFLVKMSLEEAIDLQDVINSEKEVNNSYHYEQRKGLSSLVLDKDARCGLMDDCSGKGSVFGIKLIRDVEIPVKALYKAVPDRENGNYGFMEIYGENDECFKNALKAVHEVSFENTLSAAQKAAAIVPGSVPERDISLE